MATEGTKQKLEADVSQLQISQQVTYQFQIGAIATCMNHAVVNVAIS